MPDVPAPDRTPRHRRSADGVCVKPPARGVVAMPRSGIREIMELAMTRPNVLRLEVGEPDFETPKHIVEAGARAAADGFTRYTPGRGLESLRDAIRTKLAKRNNILVDIDQIVVTTGGVTAIFEALAVLVEPGESILVPDPGWPNYEAMARTLHANVERYPLLRELGFEPDFDALERLARSSDMKALIVNTPGNPTGAVWSRATVERVLEIAQRADLYVIADEVYEEMVFEGEHTSFAPFDEDGRVISTYSFSKTYAMTGWRVGYAVAPLEIASLLAKVQEPISSCATAVAQKAAEAALLGPQDCVMQMRDAYCARRDVAVGTLTRAGLLASRPRGAFYVLADISPVTDDSYEFARMLLTDHGVAVAPGETFGPGGAGLVRLSLAAAALTIDEGIGRLVTAVGKQANKETETFT